MSLTLVSPPAIEPVTVADVTAHLRISSDNTEPSPVDAPQLVLAGLGAGNVDVGLHRYAVSFVTADGETPPGPVSTAIAVSNASTNGQVAVSNIDTGGSAVTGRKLWRTAAGGSVLLLLALIADNVTATYIDNVADASLGVQAPSVNTTVDPMLMRLITACRIRGEHATRRAWQTQTWDQFLDQWPTWDGYHGGRTFEPPTTILPAGGWVALQKPPLQSVTFVDYIDLNGNTQTWDPSNYLVDAPSGDYAARGRLSLGWVKVWPIVRPTANAIQIRTVCGYGDSRDDVPAVLRQALLLDIGTLYSIRSSVLAGSRAASVEIASTSRDIYRSFRSL